ncbi:Crp/Fnr family transcriptional regulator [Anaerobacillus isosaccharinicus]|uniref:Crp/Fnr family transcriptional regulator n=2 Tax=Anaerobacillus isosaccharinicus TaxID=1532552 RepID=A0A7S7R9R7_9BACI|nr:Crp/Fnr family transcriptional regulator [Anaerobacillus isosaccharinicus]MBA5587682.1 Crp/Fnr family transcriptional regulator [Anaerobacillus isosaccharinicus]QOY34146.1 Crp/Fnr family transcriptional regulator [Anaerobacillus isosaccharinicus]
MEKKELEMKRFFNELSKENQDLLLSIGLEITAKSGTFLFYEGDFPENVYLIREGKVRLSKMTADGKEFSVHLKQKDELVGEVGLFNDMSISVTAEVIDDAILVKFERPALEAIFRENGEIAVAFMKWFARHTQSTQAKFRDLILCGKTGAFYSTLIRFSNSYGVKSDNGILINVQLTNQDIANYIGTTRESINRMLNDLKKDKIITMDKGFITIKDIEFLKDYLHCGDCPVEICTI